MDSQASPGRYPTAPSKTDLRRDRGEWWVLVIVVLCVSGFIAFTLMRERATIRAQEADRLAVQARVVDENMTQQLAGVHAALGEVVRDYVEAGAGADTVSSRRLEGLSAALAGARSILLLDARGVVVASSRKDLIGKNFSGRDYFTAPRAKLDPTMLYVSRPFVTITGQRRTTVSRVMVDANGAFLGVATAGLEPDLFNVVLRSVLYADDMRATLVHGDGEVFLNSPPNLQALGTNLAVPGSDFARHIASGQRASLAEGPSTDTAEQHMVASRTVAAEVQMDKPFVLHVSRSMDALLGAWRSQAWLWSGAMLLVSLGAAAALRASQQRGRVLREASRAAEQSRDHAMRELLAITDNVTAMISRFDRDERCTFANPYVGDVYGIDHRVLLGKRIADMVGVDEYASMAPHIREVLDGYPASFENRTTVSGTERVLQITFVPDLAADGAVQGFHSVSFDITERKRAEQWQVRSEEKLRSILTHAPDAFVGMDTWGCITEWNREAETTFGWTRDEVLGRRLVDVIVPPRLRQAQEIELGSFGRTGDGLLAKQRAQVIAQHRDGHEIPIELSVGTVHDGDAFVGIAFLHDVSARVASDARIAATQKRLRDITDNVPAHIAYFDRDGRCEFANDAALRTYGIKRDLLHTHTLRSAVGEEHYAKHAPHVARVLAGHSEVFEAQVMHRARVLHYRSHMVPDMADDGTVRGYYLMSFDVTALKLIEHQLRELARVDTLTQLPNRRCFDERLPEALARSARSGVAMAVLMLDIDHFKSVNDTHGHAAGDAVLQAFATRLRDCVRETDTVARLAGDEFVIILEGLSARAEAESVAAKVGVAMRPAFDVGGELLRVTSSVGVAFVGAGRISPAELVAKADEALYEAKRKGRNTFALAA